MLKFLMSIIPYKKNKPMESVGKKSKILMNEKIYEMIEAISKDYPNLRIGQILTNAAMAAGINLSTMTDQELLYALEDYRTLSGIFTANI